MNLPPYLLQAAPGQETDACIDFSLCNFIFLKTGWLASPVDLARLSGAVNPNNRTVENVLTAANNIGLASYNDCPLPNPLTDADFYEPASTTLHRQKLNITLAPATSKVPYLWVQLQWGTNLPVPTNHMAVLINDGQGNFIDSEPGGQIKNLNKPTIYGSSPAKIMWESDIIINKEPMITNAKLVKNGAEWGFYIPATSDATLIDKSLNLGYLLPTIDNGAAVDWPNIKPDITIS